MLQELTPNALAPEAGGGVVAAADSGFVRLITSGRGGSTTFATSNGTGGSAAGFSSFGTESNRSPGFDSTGIRDKRSLHGLPAKF